MKSFSDRFNTLLFTEESRYGNPTFDAEQDLAEYDNGLDADADPDAFMTRGLKETINAVQSSFDSKMTSFAETLSPESVESMTMKELEDKVSNVYKYVKGISVYTGKSDGMMTSPQAILAAFIASDPAKQAAFGDLEKKLEEFSKSIEETQTQVSTLKSKIDEFVDDIVDSEDEGMDGMDDEGMDPSQGAMGPDSATPLSL